MKNISFMIIGDVRLRGLTGDEKADKSELCARKAFEKAIEIAGEYSLEYIFVPGNLFGCDSPDKETVEFVKDNFSKLLNSIIIIAPGPRDPSCIGSPYYEDRWPANVHIFKSRHFECLEFEGQSKGDMPEEDFFGDQDDRAFLQGIRIYGAGFEGHFAKEPMLPVGGASEISRGMLNVLVMHGVPDVTHSMFNPLPMDLLNAYGFDLCVLGFNSSAVKSGNIICSGAPYSLGFEEPGERGVVVGEITGNGKVRSQFIPVGDKKYTVVEINIDPYEDISAKYLCERIAGMTDKNDCTRVVFRGTVNAGTSIPVHTISKTLAPLFPMFEVVDNTVQDADVRMIASENSFRGAFVRKLHERLYAGPDGRERMDKETVDEAVSAGLNIIIADRTVKKIDGGAEDAD